MALNGILPAQSLANDGRLALVSHQAQAEAFAVCPGAIVVGLQAMLIQFFETSTGLGL
jgi:hypothetical protein